MSEIIKTKLKIIGMHCNSCALNIDFELEDLDGVVSAKTNYARQESEVMFDTQKINLNTIIDSIGKLGYKTEMIEAFSN